MFGKAVVTGGASGLGRAYCEELAKARARILIGDVDEVGAAETVRRVEALGGQARAMRCDVGDHAQIKALEAAADDWFGLPDLVINNAGLGIVGPIGEVSLEDWRTVMDVNLWGVIYGCRTFAPRMQKARHGALINIASAAGLLSPPGMGPYNVTKAAVVGFSETLHAELKPDGVAVTVVCPTFFRTNIMHSGKGVTPPAEDMELVGRLMDRSKIQAPDVARLSLKAAKKGQLYCVPMRDGRMAWRAKRLRPDTFYSAVSRAFARRKRR